MNVQVRPVSRPDVDGLIPLLSRGFDHPWPPEEWRRILDLRSTGKQPNLGFVLESNGVLVGFLGAIYSERLVAGRLERFCNLTSWYTEPEFRSSGTLLLMAVLSQPGYTFTTLTPSPTGTQVIKALGFRPLESYKVMCSPSLYRALVEKKRNLQPGGRLYKAQRALEILIESSLVTCVDLLAHRNSSPEEIDQRQIEVVVGVERIRPLLSTTEQQLLDDHPQCGHFLVLDEHSYSYVVTTNRKLSFGRRSLVDFVVSDVLHLSASRPAVRHWQSLCRVIATCQRSQAVITDERFFDGHPPNGLRLPYSSYFMSRTGLSCGQIDSLYSEIGLLDLVFYVRTV